MMTSHSLTLLFSHLTAIIQVIDSEDLRAQRAKDLSLKDSVTALRIAESLLARTSIGFVTSYTEKDRQSWNNRLLSASNPDMPLLTLSGLSNPDPDASRDKEEVECDRGCSQDMKDASAADNNIEIQLEVAVAIQKFIQSQSHGLAATVVATATATAAEVHSDLHRPDSNKESILHSSEDGQGQAQGQIGVTTSDHRIRVSFELADQIMKKHSARRGVSNQGNDLQGLNTAPATATGDEGTVGPAMCSKAFDFIFSLLQSDSTGAVLVLEGSRRSEDCNGNSGKEAHSTASTVRDFLKSCDIFEKLWILPKSKSRPLDQSTSISGSRDDNRDRKLDCKEREREREPLTCMLLSSMPLHRREMKSKKQGRRRRFLESRSTREGREAVDFALKFYTKKSEAVHTIASRARDRILSISAALKLAIVAAKQADFCCLNSQASACVENVDTISSHGTGINSSSHADISLNEVRQRANSEVSHLTYQLEDWNTALELSRLALSALWGQAVHAALSSPCLMVEVARTVLSGGLQKLSNSDPSLHYLCSEISLSFLQFWMACTSGEQVNSTQRSPDGHSLSRQAPVTMSKKDINSPAHGWQCIATHISSIQRSQLDPSNNVPVHLTGSRIALVMAVHTYILASSHAGAGAAPSSYSNPYPSVSSRVQRTMPVCGAWDLLMPLCCNASTWGHTNTDAPLNGVLKGLQLMSLTLASRACNLWVGAEKNVAPLFVSTAASLLTVRKQSYLSGPGEGEGAIRSGSAAFDKRPSSLFEKLNGDKQVYEVIAWGATQDKLAADKESTVNREVVGANDNVKWLAKPLNSLATTPSASIDVLSLSLDITKQAALSCSSLLYEHGHSTARSHLHDVMSRLSSRVFTALHLQSPFVDPIDPTASITDDCCKSESTLLQLFFASKMPQDCAAARTVFYLTRIMRRMLINTLSAGGEKEKEKGAKQVALHTRLRTSCNANLLNLLEMSRMAAIAPCSSRSTVEGIQSSDTFSLTEGICLCMAIRVVAEIVPKGETLFRYAFLPSLLPSFLPSL